MHCTSLPVGTSCTQAAEAPCTTSPGLLWTVWDSSRFGTSNCCCVEHAESSRFDAEVVNCACSSAATWVKTSAVTSVCCYSRGRPQQLYNEQFKRAAEIQKRPAAVCKASRAEGQEWNPEHHVMHLRCRTLYQQLAACLPPITATTTTKLGQGPA